MNKLAELQRLHRWAKAEMQKPPGPHFIVVPKALWDEEHITMISDEPLSFQEEDLDDAGTGTDLQWRALMAKLYPDQFGWRGRLKREALRRALAYEAFRKKQGRAFKLQLAGLALLAGISLLLLWRLL